LTQRNKSSSNVHSDDLNCLFIYYSPKFNGDESIDELWRILPQIPFSVTTFVLPLCHIDRSEDYAYICVGMMPRLETLSTCFSLATTIETVEEYGMFADQRTLSRLSLCPHLKFVSLYVRDVRSCSSAIKTLIKSCPKLEEIELLTPKLSETASKLIINEFGTELQNRKVDMSIDLEDDIYVPRLISRLKWTIIG